MTQAPAEPSAEERQWAMFANLAGILALVNIPFANVVGSLVIYLKGRSENLPFVREHARNALNFQITFSIVFLLVMFGALAGWAGFIVWLAAHTDEMRRTTTGFPVGVFAFFFAIFGSVAILQIANVVLSALGAVAASSGRSFRYPAIPFVR